MCVCVCVCVCVCKILHFVLSIELPNSRQKRAGHRLCLTEHVHLATCAVGVGKRGIVYTHAELTTTASRDGRITIPVTPVTRS